MSRRLAFEAKKALANDPNRSWHLFDAAGQPVGRIATQIARFLAGKHKPVFNQRLDRGDAVVVINAEKLALEGPRWRKKEYTSHSGYPGGKKVIEADKLMEKNPERILEKAVWGMLPNNNYKGARISRLKIYKGEEHEFKHKFEGARIYRDELSPEDRAVLSLD